MPTSKLKCARGVGGLGLRRKASGLLGAVSASRTERHEESMYKKS